MGTKDSKAKEYLSDNMRFSEICNYVLFDGEKVIKPENLKECDTTEVLSVFGIDRKQIVKQKWRDLLKGVSVKYTESVYIVLMGIEAQTDVHYAMPVKTMIYDAMNYGEQVNEAKKQHQKNKDYKSSDEFLSYLMSVPTNRLIAAIVSTSTLVKVSSFVIKSFSFPSSDAFFSTSNSGLSPVLTLEKSVISSGFNRLIL